MDNLTKTVLSLAMAASSCATFASEAMEEVIVTARQQAEGLQDVPVTIAAMTEEDLDRYNITNLSDAAKMVPNMVIAQGGSGNGSTLRLRGIGSSSISAAFDHSVAINLDGVVVNRGRFIHNSCHSTKMRNFLKSKNLEACELTHLGIRICSKGPKNIREAFCQYSIFYLNFFVSKPVFYYLFGIIVFTHYRTL